MAELNQNSTMQVSAIQKLRTLIDAYGVAVRAGAITPQSEDENYFRELMDLPDMSQQVIQNWKDSDNVRRPITISKVEEEEPESTDPNNDNNE